MTETQCKELREWYQKEYKIKTGRTLVCIERKRISKGAKKLHKDMVLDIAAKWFGVTKEKLVSKSREGELIEYRQMIAKVFTQKCKCSSFVTAAYLGNMERSTISNTLHRFELMYKTDKNYRQRFNEFNTHCAEEFNKVVYYENTGEGN